MNNKKKLVAALSLILCLSVSVSIAVAYFTDYEAAKGGAVLHLKGEDVIEEKFDDNEKVVSVRNTGETDLLVRVRALGENVIPNSKNSSDWVSDPEGIWWYYNGVLKPDNSTPEIRFEVKNIPADADAKDFDVTVVQEAVRVTYTQDADGNNIVAAPDGWTGFPTIADNSDSDAE